MMKSEIEIAIGFDQVCEFFNGLLEKKNNLHARIKDLEAIQNNLRHELENTKLNASQSCRVANAWKRLLEDRRAAKHDLKIIEAMQGHINVPTIQQSFAKARNGINGVVKAKESWKDETRIIDAILQGGDILEMSSYTLHENKNTKERSK